MRIGLFTDSYLPVVNGISFVVESTRHELEKMGHEVYVFAPSPSLRYREDDKQVIRYRAIKGLVYQDNLTSLVFPPRELRRINQLDLDVIHFFTPLQVGLLGAYAALNLGIPLVQNYSTNAYEYSRVYPVSLTLLLILMPTIAPLVAKTRLQEWRKALRAASDREVDEAWRQRMLAEVLTILNNRCDAVVVLSHKMEKLLKQWDKSPNLWLIPTGVDALPVSKKTTEFYRNLLNISEHNQVVLYVGRLAAEKNLDLLLSAFELVASKNPSAKLLFVGDFEYRATLQKMAESLGCADSIIFSGMIDHEELGSIYAIADVFAFPSLTDTQGLVINEAAAAGLPLVLIDQGLNEAAVNGKNALYAQNDPKDFAAKLLEVLDNKAVAQSMAKQSLKIAQNFTAKKQAKELEKLYKSLLSRVS